MSTYAISNLPTAQTFHDEDTPVDTRTGSAANDVNPIRVAINPGETAPPKQIPQRVIEWNAEYNNSRLALPTAGQRLAPQLPPTLQGQLGGAERSWKGVPAGAALTDRVVLGEVGRFLRDNGLGSGLPAAWSGAQRDRFASLVVTGALSAQRDGRSAKELGKDLLAIYEMVNNQSRQLPLEIDTSLNVGVDNRPLQLPDPVAPTPGANPSRSQALDASIVDGPIKQALYSVDPDVSRRAYVAAYDEVKQLPPADQLAVGRKLDTQYLNAAGQRASVQEREGELTLFSQVAGVYRQLPAAAQEQVKPLADALLNARQDLATIRVAGRLLRTDTNNPPMLPTLDVTLSSGRASVNRTTIDGALDRAKQNLQTAQQAWAKGVSGIGAAGDATAGASGQIFSSAEAALLQNAHKVVAFTFSSTGGGHTERGLKPLLVAADTPSNYGTSSDKVINPGDVILIVLPPHWESDSGNEAKQLKKYAQAYEAKGIHVILKQENTSLFGFYKPDGPSNNWKILENFVNIAARDPQNTPTPAFGTGEIAPAFEARDIMLQAVQASGNPDKFVVFSDMGPAVAEGALLAGIKKDRIIEQSNHVGLVDPSVEFDGRSDAFLLHANNFHAGSTALIGFDANINKLTRLADAFTAMNISPTTPKQEVRRQMTELVLKEGNRLSLDTPVGTGGGILVAPEANAKSIDRMVYLYLNAYTGPLGQHIQDKLKEPGDNPYKHTLFIVAGGQAIPGQNAMNIAQLANADGVVAGGMGTTTEAQQLATNGYQGKTIFMPVQDQHEQQANAHQLLPAALPPGLPEGTVSTATDNADLQRRVDDLVENRATTTESLTGDLQDLYNTANGPRRVTDQPVALLDGGPMTQTEFQLNQINSARAQRPDATAMRHLVYAVVPALNAASAGEPSVTVKMGPQFAAQTLTLTELAATLRDRNKAAELLHADTSGPETRKLLQEVASRLERIAATTDPERRTRLIEGFKQEFANNKYILGY